MMSRANDRFWTSGGVRSNFRLGATVRARATRRDGPIAPKAGIKASVLFVRADHLFGSRPDRAR